MGLSITKAGEGGPLTIVLHLWSGALLAVSILTDIMPEKLIRLYSNQHAYGSIKARGLLVKTWRLLAGMEEASAWCCSVMGLSARSIDRLLIESPCTKEELARCVASARVLAAQFLTPEQVRVAIAAGWTGSDRRGAAPWRKSAHLLSAAQEWLRAEYPELAVQPESTERPLNRRAF